jgi:uncharacterized membrane protein YgcG
MNRLLLLFAVLLAWAGPARAADIPPRPKPFTFVNDQAKMLNANDAKKLENGLRKYADTYGTQVVLVTVPSLGGASAAEYARQLGTDWGVGQRDKNNGIVVLLSGQDRQMSIEAGSGLRSVITPDLTRRVIRDEMTPAFKQGNYFAGLSKGLGTIMLAANPSSDPRKDAAATTPATASSAATPSGTSSLNDNAATTTSAEQYPAATPTPEPTSSGFGLGSILIGVLVIGGGIWLVSKLFNRNKNTANQAPDFMGNRPTNNPTPNFGAPNQGYPQGQGNYGGGYGGPAPSSGSGMGGILATGAAAAAGAYLGNRMAGGGDHDSSANNFGTGAGAAAGFGGGAGTAPPANAASDYFGERGGNAGNDAGPDYFSGNDSGSSDSFFSDSGSYDDTSSGDTGGGGFDSTDDDNNSGSW